MAIRWDKLTLKAQEAIKAAGELASQNGNAEILPSHLLAALMSDTEGIVTPVLAKIGVDAEAVRGEAEAAVERLPKVSGGSAQPQLSNKLSKAMDQAFKEAGNFKDEYVSTEHLLLALSQLRGDDAGQTPGAARRYP